MEFHHFGLIAIFWIAIVAIVFFSSLFGYLDRANRYRTIQKLAESGQPVPQEYLGPYYPRRYWRYGHPIASGIQLMCVGIALALFFWAMTGWGTPFDEFHHNSWLPFVGIFPFMIGLSRVLVGIFDRPPPK